jgi:hypothetical protein
MSTRRITQDQKDQLIQLHLAVFGYVSSETHETINAMSYIRAMQETAMLMRRKAAKDRSDDKRRSLRELHIKLFGSKASADKLKEIHTYDDERVLREIATLTRMMNRKDGS